MPVLKGTILTNEILKAEIAKAEKAKAKKIRKESRFSSYNMLSAMKRAYLSRELPRKTWHKTDNFLNGGTHTKNL